MTDYRPDITKKLKELLKANESFKIISKPGLGKSKYLRNIVKNPEFIKSFLKPNKIEIHYIDFNRIYQKNADQLVRILAEKINTKKRLKGIEDYLEKSKNKFFLILDHFELAENMDNSISQLISSLMSNYKEKFNIIISTSNLDFLKKKQFDYIREQSSLNLKFSAQGPKKIRETIKDFSLKYNIKLNKEETDTLARKSKGYPLKVKQILIKMLEGHSLNEALKIIEEEHKHKKKLKRNTNKLSKYQKHLTRSEFLFLEKLYSKKGNIVGREELAYVLSPQSEGAGVSNEAIDQIISRLRKSLRKIEAPIEIKNKRGVGYYIEKETL